MRKGKKADAEQIILVDDTYAIGQALNYLEQHLGRIVAIVTITGGEAQNNENLTALLD